MVKSIGESERDKSKKDKRMKIKRVKISYCPDCKQYSWKNKQLDQKRFLDKLISLIMYNKECKNLVKRYEQDLEKIKRSKIKKISLRLPQSNRIVEVIIEKKVCHKCVKKKSQYYEAIILISKKTTSKDKFGLIKRFIKDYCKEKDINIVKIEENKKDIRFRIQNWRKGQEIINKLIEKFSGYVKITRTLHSQDRQTSKRIYKITMNYVPLNFDVGDVIRFDDHYFIINHIGKEIKAINVNKELKIKITKFNAKSLENKRVDKIKKYDLEVISLKPLMVMLKAGYDTIEPIKVISVRESKAIPTSELIRDLDEHWIDGVLKAVRIFDKWVLLKED